MVVQSVGLCSIFVETQKEFTMKKIIFLFLIVHCTLLIDNCLSQWVQVGLPNMTLFSLAYSENNIFAVSGGSGLYLSTNNGSNWKITSLVYNSEVSSLAVNGSNIFAGTYYGVYLSTNNGTNWTQTSLTNNIFSLIVNGNNIFAGTYLYGVYLSSNNGISWIQTSLNNRSVHALAVNGNNVFCGTRDSGVYKSTNNGTSWIQTSLNNRWIPSLAVNGNNIFAGAFNPLPPTITSKGVYLSTNNGTTWTQTSLNNRNVQSLAVNGDNTFAGTEAYGVYVSTDNGTSWIQRNEGLSNPSIHAFCIFNNYIFASAGLGVFRRSLGELVGIQPISNEIPNQFSLGQNYPNPFNPNTVISFQLAVNSFATIKVYDLLGREVATLVNEQLQPGTYEVDWYGSNFSSGIYYYKIVAGDYTETKKMVLMK